MKAVGEMTEAEDLALLITMMRDHGNGRNTDSDLVDVAAKIRMKRRTDPRIQEALQLIREHGSGENTCGQLSAAARKIECQGLPGSVNVIRRNKMIN